MAIHPRALRVCCVLLWFVAYRKAQSSVSTYIRQYEAWGRGACVSWWEITCYRSPWVEDCARTNLPFYLGIANTKLNCDLWENYIFMKYHRRVASLKMVRGGQINLQSLEVFDHFVGQNPFQLTNTKRNHCTVTPFLPDTWHVGPPQVGRHLAHPPHTLLLHFCRTDSHCTCGCPLWACGGVTCKMSLPAVTSPKAQWLTPKLMALPPAGEDGDDHECINMPPKIKMTKLHKTLNTCKI